jgi:hypothetical protein
MWIFSMQLYDMNIRLSTSVSELLSLSFPCEAGTPVILGRARDSLGTQICAQFLSSSPANKDVDVPDDNVGVTRISLKFLTLIKFPRHFQETAHNIVIRASSPTPTEVEDPEPDQVLSQLQSLHIKVRDFAYELPYHPATSPKSTAGTLLTAAANSPSPPAQVAHIPEIFDQYRGIAEVEYRLAQPAPRTAPISGKTLRYLFNLGWLSGSEAQERLHQIDWDALKAYDERTFGDDKGKHKGQYPWRPCTWTHVPDKEERRRILLEHGKYFVSYDRIMMKLELAAERERAEKKKIEETEKYIKLWEEWQMREMVEDVGSTPGKDVKGVQIGLIHPLRKRTLDIMDTEPSVSSSDPKRPRPTVPAIFKAPPKQYPAPLSSYDPIVYPEAKSAIELSEQMHPRPPPPLLRMDTPPADADENSERRLDALMRTKRGCLGWTQTFAQL